jgi:hypothetical protein
MNKGRMIRALDYFSMNVCIYCKKSIQDIIIKSTKKIHTNKKSVVWNRKLENCES